MTAFSALRTRAYARCGITTASTAEQELMNEALNAAIAFHAAALPAQLRQTFSGYSQAALSTSVSSHTAANTYLVLASTTGVYPGDILNDTANSKSFLIRTVDSTTVDFGIPMAASISGNSVTVTRRSLPMPTSGTVMEVVEKDGARPLTYNPLISVRAQFETGTAQYWTQQFSTTGGASYVSLFPAPSAATQYLFVTFPAFAEDADVYMSPGLIEAILATAVEYRHAMGGGGGLPGAARMAAAQEMLRSRSSGGHGVIERK